MNETKNWKEKELFVRFSPNRSVVEVDDVFHVDSKEVKRVAKLIRNSKLAFPRGDKRLIGAVHDLLDVVAERVERLLDTEEDE